MKTKLLLTLFSLLTIHISAQTTLVKGRVTDPSKNPLAGANIILRDSYDGATADTDGNFEFETEESGPQTLQVTYLGFDSVVQQVTLSGGVFEFNPVMREAFNELKVVVISAGAFEASDEKKVTVLKPLDIVTTASAGGDTYGALRTLPGSQVSTGDVEGLFVRGGSGSEAPTFIDGMLVRNPFFASSPDYAARGRFNPFLFKGTIFSTGGYSAQYGQGMSSAIILESQDLPDRSAGTAAISSVGLGYGQVQLSKDKRRSIGGGINYNNLAPYFWVVKEKPDFTQSPESAGAELFFRQKTGETGIIKFYGNYNWGRFGFNTEALDGDVFGFSVKNNNVYTNLSWSNFLTENWKLQLGTSLSRDWNDIGTSFNTGNLSPDTFFLRNYLGQFRAVATRFYGRLSSLRFGAEFQFGKEEFENRLFGTSNYNDQYSAAFVEADVYMTTKLVARLGVRGEYSKLLDQGRISPRVSLAYKLGEGDQVSFAWGHFYQKGDSLLRWQSQFGTLPGFQRAEHVILNYQYILNDRTFRVEAFYKKYRDLITTRGDLRNDGTGYAQGIELFYRDKKSVKNMDFWFSYSWLDTKRIFQWYPVEAQPTYAANHVSTLVVKKFFPDITTSLSLSYNYATGRPYYNPNRTADEFLSDRTPDYHNLSLSVSYITAIRNTFAVFVLSVQNVLRQDQIFDYRYSSDGSMRTEITPAAKQFFFIGAFFSWGTDRSQEVLDKQI